MYIVTRKEVDLNLTAMPQERVVSFNQPLAQLQEWLE